jgi:hypothetical protein
MYPAAVALRTYPGTLLTSRQLQLSHCTGSDDLSQEFFYPALTSPSFTGEPRATARARTWDLNRV